MINQFYQPFSPTPDVYQFDPTSHSLYTLNLVTGKRRLLLPLSFGEGYSFLAFNEQDACLYGYQAATHMLCRIDASGALSSYLIADLPDKLFTCGCFDTSGALYLYQTLDSTFYRLQLIFEDDKERWTLMASTPITPLALSDWCFDCTGKILYSISELGQLVQIDPLTGTYTQFSCVGLPSDPCILLVTDYEGYLYGLFTNNRFIYRLKKSDTYWVGELFGELTDPCYYNGTRAASTPLYISSSSAPSPYATTLAENMARHGLVSFLKFDTLSSSPTSLYITDTVFTYTLSVSNLTDAPAFLYSWIDWNGNGHFEISEALPPLTIAPGLSNSSITLTFKLPKHPSIVMGGTYMRLRLTSDELTYTSDVTTFDTRSLGPASDGMVLDIALTITADSPICTESYDFETLMDKKFTHTLKVSDPCKGTLHYGIVQEPTYGKLILHPTDGTWEYMPSTSHAAIDHFVLSATSSISHLSCDIPIALAIQLPDLKLTTACTHKEAAKHTIITYTSIIENTGSLPFSNLCFSCRALPGATYVAGSTSINNLVDSTCDPLKGIILSHLPPSELFILRYDFVIDTRENCKVDMSSAIEGTFFLNPNSPPTYITRQSTPLPLTMISPNLDVAFSCNTPEALIGDSILYTIKLMNTGSIPLTDIILTLPPSDALAIDSQLIVDHCTIDTSIVQGYTIPHLAIGASALIQIKATVVEGANSLDTLLFVDYNYLLNQERIASKNNVFSVPLDILIPNIVFSQTCHTTTASIDDTLHYTVTLTNNGRVPVTEGLLTTQLPACFKITKLLLNEELIRLDPYNKIQIPGFSLGDTHTLEMYLKVTDIPMDDTLFKHLLTASLSTKSLVGTGSSSFTLESVDTTGVLIVKANLSLDKTCDFSEYCVGEKVVYTLHAKNTGTVPLHDVVIQDLLSPELEFVSDSLQLNASPMPHLSIISGIQLGTLQPNDCITISFQALILSKGNGIIKNTALAYYTFFPDGKQTPKLHSLYSNVCTLSVIETHLHMEGTFDKSLAFLNDTILCTVTLTNKGNIPLFNLMLNVSLFACAVVKRSFYVNNTLINTVDLTSPILLGDLASSASIKLTFSLQVLHSYLVDDLLKNILVCHFAYNTTDKCVKYSETAPLTLSLSIALTTFKLIGLENYLEIPYAKPDLEMINSVGGQINILKDYVITTPKGTSSDGQILTGKMLLVHGILNLSTDYVAAVVSNPIHSIHSAIPFSAYVIVPEDTPLNVQTHIQPTIKNISFKIVNNRCYFVHSSLLLSVRLR